MGLRAVLAQRGVGPAAQRAYEVGYASPGWARPQAHLRRVGATDRELVDAGLAVATARSAVIDRFRDR